MTLIDKVFEYIREHPTDTPTEIGKALDIQRGHASTLRDQFKKEI